MSILNPLLRPAKRSLAPPIAKPTPKPATGRCGLTLRINGQNYAVKKLEPEYGGMKAFRLTKPNNEFHDVARNVYGMECSCPDWIFRRDGIDEAGCKHIKACQATGLID